MAGWPPSPASGQSAWQGSPPRWPSAWDGCDRNYTALFSNTFTAHRLGRTHDWVVMYYDGGREEHQCTVVTARQGPLAGRRVVRGREAECLEHYRSGTEAHLEQEETATLA
jgi:hypothetical protein